MRIKFNISAFCPFRVFINLQSILSSYPLAATELSSREKLLVAEKLLSSNIKVYNNIAFSDLRSGNNFNTCGELSLKYQGTIRFVYCMNFPKV